MKLMELLQDVLLLSPIPNPNEDIQGLSEDSRTVGKNFIFFARKGNKTSGHQFIDEAFQKGAAVVLTEEKSVEKNRIQVQSILEAQSLIASKFYKNPSQHMTVIGITGTNGKTTITYMLESIAKEMGWRVGVIGTINYRLPQEDPSQTEILPSPNTTPNILELQKIFSLMKNRGVDLVVMEVSSHALYLNRVSGIEFDGAIFTNLTQDHLDFHKDLENYFASKAKLFLTMNRKKKGFPGAFNKFSIINIEDSFGKRLLSLSTVPALSYGIQCEADFTAEAVLLASTGSQFKTKFHKTFFDVTVPFLGRHNVYNALAAIGASIQLGIPNSVILRGLKNLNSVPGRLEPINCGQNFTVLVDYAHTEDALKNVLQSLRPLANKRILTLFGCGGDRDKLKRPLMGMTATALSDWVILTSDNPRSEDPQKILQDIEAGIKRKKKKNYSIIADRITAIEKILMMAKELDIVLIAGKGHETVQIFKDKCIHHDDREIVRKILCTP